jgi:ribosomal protein S18 acetylase RimI-like enzyme
MVVTIPASVQAPGGARPINLNRDIPQVLRLLELVFGRVLGPDGQRLFSGSLNSDRQPAFLWRFSPVMNKLAMGYVWEEDDQIIGNVTVLNTKSVGRYLVVNVAVHPDYRRRGIAQELMKTVIKMTRKRQGRKILLQVVKDNNAAINLYRSLDFITLGNVTTWRCHVSRLRELSTLTEDSRRLHVRELRRQEWQAAHELDLSAQHPDLNWPESLPADRYRGGVRRWVDRFFNGRQTEHWVTTHQEKLVGLVSIRSEWSRPHQVALRVHPEWHGQLERPLVAKAIRRLQQMPRRSVRIEHPEDPLISELLREANMQAERTLTHMYLDL